MDPVGPPGTEEAVQRKPHKEVPQRRRVENVGVQESGEAIHGPIRARAPDRERRVPDYVYAYEERFEAKAGPLRSVVRPTVEAFLDCGRLYGGFARIRCPSCHSEHLLAFSCQTRNYVSRRVMWRAAPKAAELGNTRAGRAT